MTLPVRCSSRDPRGSAEGSELCSASGALPAEGADGLRAARDGAQRPALLRFWAEKGQKGRDLPRPDNYFASSPFRVNSRKFCRLHRTVCSSRSVFIFPMGCTGGTKGRMDPSHLEHEFSHPVTLCFLPSSCIVTGDVRGQVKFYDGHLQLLACYEHSATAPIRSISFSKTPPDPPSASCTSSQPFTAR